MNLPHSAIRSIFSHDLNFKVLLEGLDLLGIEMYGSHECIACRPIIILYYNIKLLCMCN